MKRAVSGLRAWLVQRASAVYMLFFIVFLLLHFLLDPPRSYQDWRGWMLGPGASITTSVFFAALLVHAWVGVRDVIMDYVRPPAVRFFALVLLGLGLAMIGVWLVRILWLMQG